MVWRYNEDMKILNYNAYRFVLKVTKFSPEVTGELSQEDIKFESKV